jgi:hypothetical protein
MPITWDNAGRLVPPGKVTRALEANFLDGTLPAWLTVTTGSAGHGATASTTGAVSGNVATVRTAATFSMSDMKAVRWDANGLWFDSSKIMQAIGIGNSNGVGGYVRQDSTDDTLQMLMNGEQHSLSYNIRAGGEHARHRNLGLLLLPATRELYVLEDDQVMAYRQSSTFTTGAVRPDLTVVTRENSAHYFRVTQIRLTIWSD